MGIDTVKCAKLKTDLEAMPPQEAVVPINRFFEGNDDRGSIGCNLTKHPGIGVFRDIFTTLLARPDVSAAYARIAEIDPGEDLWPFTDTVFIVGKIPLDDLRDILAPLQPDEIGPGQQFAIPAAINDEDGTPVLAAWWD